MEEDLSEFSFLKESTVTSSFPKIIVVRHAESIANRQGIYQGQTYDTDLSDLGIKQAEKLAKKASELGIRKIISSPLKRAYQTALAVSKLADCPVEVDVRLIEISHGVWEGKHKDWIKENYPQDYDIWKTRPYEVIFPEGESLIDVASRIDNLLQDSLLEDNTMVITHDSVVRVMISMHEDSFDNFWGTTLESASLNFFEINKISGKNKLKALKLNDNKHLENLRADIFKQAL